jgi:hypothetical protein
MAYLPSALWEDTRLAVVEGAPKLYAALSRLLEKMKGSLALLLEAAKSGIERILVTLYEQEGYTTSYAEPDKLALKSHAERNHVAEFLMRQKPRAVRGLTEFSGVEGTVAWLVDRYRKDPDSPYHAKSFTTRKNYENLVRRLLLTCASARLEEMDARMFLRLHEKWSDGGKVAMGHAMIGIVRILANFGGSILGNQECSRIASVLQKMRFPISSKRAGLRLTEDHVHAIIEGAHAIGHPSIALAQALQFDCKLRQKEVIGEWVPETESFMSDVMHNGLKWVRGLRWSEIDEQFVIRRPKNRRNGVDLKKAPLVMAEFEKRPNGPGKDGPMIVFENNGLPYNSAQYRRVWRQIADAAGVPKEVKNMDSRTDEE